MLPIVLYNGAAGWRAPEDIGPLIEAGPRALEQYRLQARYLLIDERQHRDSDLAPLRNLVAALFRLENSRSHADIREVLGLLVEWLKSPDQASLRRAFAVWINRVILGTLPGGPVTRVEDLQTMGTLLEERIQEWAEESERKGLKAGRERGLQEGREQGRLEGLQEGEALLLHRLLRKRFGELPGWVWPRLQEAQPEQLDRWGERLLEVDSLGALFEGEI